MDVVEALKKIKVPNLRWPGGCFADQYNWKDGIGPKAQRRSRVNTNWGMVVEDNSFGTDEFLDLCERIGCEPYIAANMGSGTPSEMQEWIEYLNYDGNTSLTKMRAANGHPKPYKVSFIGVGNESWGCGGNMTPAFYVNEYKKFATYAVNYPGSRLKKVASGGYGDQYIWTETLIRDIPHDQLWGISLHHYVVPNNWNKKGSATDFTEAEYFSSMKKAIELDGLLTKHSEVMDKYDPEKRIALVLDEWGIWTDVEPGTNPGFLYQQNSLRDALIAGTILNMFNNHAERVRMANLAQTVNVLQSVILTKGDQMLLTPTYHVFDMLKVHQDATLIPIKIESPDYVSGNEKISSVNVSASKDSNGVMHFSIVNLDLNQSISLKLKMDIRSKSVSGSVLTSAKINDINTFEKKDKIQPVKFDGFTKASDGIDLRLPAKSLVVIEIR